MKNLPFCLLVAGSGLLLFSGCRQPDSPQEPVQEETEKAEDTNAVLEASVQKWKDLKTVSCRMVTTIDLLVGSVRTADEIAFSLTEKKADITSVTQTRQLQASSDLIRSVLHIPDTDTPAVCEDEDGQACSSSVNRLRLALCQPLVLLDSAFDIQSQKTGDDVQVSFSISATDVPGMADLTTRFSQQTSALLDKPISIAGLSLKGKLRLNPEDARPCELELECAKQDSSDVPDGAVPLSRLIRTLQIKTEYISLNMPLRLQQ